MILFFDMQSGVSGDMILGALFDLGLDFPAWLGQMRTLPIPAIPIEVKSIVKHGLAARQFIVAAPHEHAHRGLQEITGIINGSRLSKTVRDNAIRVFKRLAEVEAKIHGVEIEKIYFHEVGAVDAIIDIVGACLGFEMLGITEFITSPFPFGKGSVRSAHGLLSEPVPATLALTQGFPSWRTDLPGELCTPTGAALVTTFAKPCPPDWTAVVDRLGYGAGSRDIPNLANVLRICLMQPTPQSHSQLAATAFQIECNLDNMVPEILAHVVERLLAAGAKDAWQEPIVMKKNGAAVKLCALAELADLQRVLDVFIGETSTGGLRYFPVQRLVAEKGVASVDTPFGSVELKKVLFPGTQARYTPEFESCRALAIQSARPLQEIYRAAIAAATRLNDLPETAVGSAESQIDPHGSERKHHAH